MNIDISHFLEKNMIKINRCIWMLMLFCGLQSPIAAYAGILEVFGDVNSMSNNTTPRNTLLNNLLGSGTSVVVSDKLPGDFPDGTTFNSHYNSLGGVSSTLTTATVNSALLSGVDLLFLNIGCCGVGQNANPYSVTEISAMSTFLQGGGNIGILEEPCCFDANAAAYMNSMLSALGSTIQYAGWSSTSGTATMAASPLTAGVVGYFPTTFGYFTGGTSLATLNGLTMIASDNITSVPEPVTLAMLGLGLLGLCFSRRRAWA